MTNTQVCVTRKGFTLIEILIAIAIMAVVATVVGPTMLSYLTGGQESATKANLRSLKLALNSYYLNVHSYPESLRDLSRKPSDEAIAKKWKGPYLEEVPLDGWDSAFQYKKPGEEGHPFELYSYGPNGKGAPKEEWLNVWKL